MNPMSRGIENRMGPEERAKGTAETERLQQQIATNNLATSLGIMPLSPAFVW